MAKKTKNQLLSEKLLLNKQSAWNKLPHKSVHDFADPYKEFLSQCKTEREVVDWAVKQLRKAGYKDIETKKKISKGDLVYKRTDKTLMILRYNGFDRLRLVVSHVDSPRLDLKPFPLVEDSHHSLLKTHYYGGIVKYHWVNIPLAIHGVVMKKNGEKLHLQLGEKDSDPVFVISDLLPHLGRQRMKSEAGKVIPGENLSIVFGTMPVDDPDIVEQVKLYAMDVLHKKYGLVEEDFSSAELEVVPAFKARDCGIDNSMIAAYGQDDRSCSYCGLKSLIEAKSVKHSAITVLFDKEEIGSEGKTGANSELLKHFIRQIIAMSSSAVSFADLMSRTEVISADVTAAFDPNYKDSFDIHNASFLGRGVSLEKYNGYGGKFGSSDASAEFMFSMRSLLNKHKVPWQYGELGKIDDGGGGTISVFIAGLGADVVDAGPAVLGMHSPYEILSKADLYSAYLFYKAFFEQS